MSPTLKLLCLLFVISGGVAQQCIQKQFSYVTTTICTGITGDYPNATNLARSFQCLECNIPTIDDKTFKNFRGDIFNITSGNIQTLEDTAFKTYWHTVKSFILVGNKIEKVPAGIFTKFSGLRVISFKDNKLRKIEDGVFDKVNVNTLDLSINGLSDVRYSFDGLTAHTLNLSFNQIQELPRGVFEKLALKKKDYNFEFETLLLQNNRISAIYNGSFVLKGNLRLLRLENNALSTLPNGSFEQATGLVQLYLNNNTIEFLQPDSLKGLVNLNILDLSQNRIEVLPFGLFKNMQQLRTLLLRENQLKSLQMTSFSGLIQLTKLDISSNRLRVLDDTILFPMGKLNYLDISNNQIQELEIEPILEHHTNLKSLNVNNNFWTCNNLVSIYKWLNRKSGSLVSPASHYNVPNLHGIACSRVGVVINDDMTFEEFLKVISQDMVLEDLYDVRLGQENEEFGGNQVVDYLRDIFYLQLIVTTIIVLIVCFLLCVIVNSYLQKNNISTKIKFLYHNKADNVELLP